MAGWPHGFPRLMNCDALDIEGVKEMGTELGGGTGIRTEVEPEVRSAGCIRD